MKSNVSLSDFRNAFRDHNRENFSYEGLEALYNWIEEMDDNCGTETELDVIALCCEFTEYKNLAEFHQNYSIENYETIDDVSNETAIIMIDDDRFIIHDF